MMRGRRNAPKSVTLPTVRRVSHMHGATGAVLYRSDRLVARQRTIAQHTPIDRPNRQPPDVEEPPRRADPHRLDPSPRANARGGREEGSHAASLVQ